MKSFQCSPRSKYHKCSQVRLPGVAPCQRVFFQRKGAHTVRLYRVTHTKGSDLCKCNLRYRWATFSNGYTCRSSVVVVREGRDKIMNLELISAVVVKLDWTVKTSDVPWCGQYSFQKVLASSIIKKVDKHGRKRHTRDVVGEENIMGNHFANLML